MSEQVRNIVDLAINDKPNKASDAFADEMMDRIAPAVDVAKSVVSNALFGQDYIEPEEEQPEDEELHSQEIIDTDIDDDDDVELEDELEYEFDDEDEDEV